MKNYLIDEIIYSNSFSTVHKATEKTGGKTYSIEIINVENVDQQNTMKEVQTLINLSHPNILNYHEIFAENKQIYIVREFCGDKILKQFIAEQKYPLQEEFIRALFFK
jgi:serine/threonine protein kinase